MSHNRSTSFPIMYSSIPIPAPYPALPMSAEYTSTLTDYHLSLRQAMADAQARIVTSSSGSSTLRDRARKRESPKDYQFTVIPSPVKNEWNTSSDRNSVASGSTSSAWRQSKWSSDEEMTDDEKRPLRTAPRTPSRRDRRNETRQSGSITRNALKDVEPNSMNGVNRYRARTPPKTRHMAADSYDGEIGIHPHPRGDVLEAPGLSESSSPSSSEGSNGSADVDGGLINGESPSRSTQPGTNQHTPCPIVVIDPPTSTTNNPNDRTFFNSHTHHITLPLPPPARILFARQLSGISSLGSGSNGGGYSTTEDSEDSFEAVQDSPMCTPMITPPVFLRGDSGRSFLKWGGGGGGGGYLDARRVGEGAVLQYNRDIGGPRIKELTVGQINGGDSWRSREHPIVPKIKERWGMDDALEANPTRTSIVDDFALRGGSLDLNDTIRSNATARANSIHSRTTIDTVRSRPSTSFSLDRNPPISSSVPPATPDRKKTSARPTSPSTPRSLGNNKLFRKFAFHRGSGKDKDDAGGVKRGGWFGESGRGGEGRV